MRPKQHLAKLFPKKDASLLHILGIAVTYNIMIDSLGAYHLSE